MKIITEKSPLPSFLLIRYLMHLLQYSGETLTVNSPQQPHPPSLFLLPSVCIRLRIFCTTSHLTLIPKTVVCCAKLKLKISTKTIEAMFDLINLIFVNIGLCEFDGSSKFQMRLGWGQQKVSKVVERSENDSVEHSSGKQVHG